MFLNLATHDRIHEASVCNDQGWSFTWRWVLVFCEIMFENCLQVNLISKQFKSMQSSAYSSSSSRL